MQGLPFDESDFPPQVSVSSTWMDQSPRIAAPSNPAATAVTDDELYRMVGAQPPSPASSMPQPAGLHGSSVEFLQRLAQQTPISSPAPSALYVQQHAENSLPHHSHHASPPNLHHALPHQPQEMQRPTSHHHPHQVRPTHISQPHEIPQHTRQTQLSSTSRGMTSPASVPIQMPNQPVQPIRSFLGRRPRTEVSVPDGPREGTRRACTTPTASTVTVVQHDQISPKHHASPAGITGGATAAPGTTATLGVDPEKKPIRSAVEEARLRAQREAETYASSRRDPGKREPSLSGQGVVMNNDSPCWEGIMERQHRKRLQSEIEPEGNSEKRASRRVNSRSSTEKRDEQARPEDDSEVEKQERYKRRLDMNRESAAVSRVRRRAYVKELEERLAACEAEKLQLQGKLDIMLMQNEGFKQQLEHLFMMVASGRRPSYPHQPPLPPAGDGS